MKKITIPDIKNFFVHYRREIKEVCLGVIFAFSCVFIIKRVFSPPVLHFSKLILERQNAHMENALKETPVEAFTVKKTKIKERIDALAMVKADAFVDIKIQKHHMRIKEILFDEGNMVQKDQPLIQFDDTEAKSNYENAKARMAFELAVFKRAQYLFSKDAASKNEVQEAEGKYKAAEGQCEEAEAVFNSTLVKSPITGVAGVMENATVGTLVSPERTIVSIVNDQNEVKITFKVPLRFINSFKLGQKVLFKTEAFQTEFEGYITAIDSKINESDLLVQASITNTSDLLKSGMLGQAQIITDNEMEGILIPQTSLVKQAENYVVPVIERGKIVNKLAIKGPEVDKDVIIAAGLESGDIVVKNAPATGELTDGLRVMVLKLDDKDTGMMAEALPAGRRWFSYSFGFMRLICRYIVERNQEALDQIPVNVNAETARTRKVYKKSTAIGTIRSQEFVELKSHVQHTKIKSIHFQEGDFVNAGDILIAFDDAEARGLYNKAKGNFDAREKIFKRMQLLHQTNSISQAEFEKNKTEYEVAKAELSVSQFRLENMTIKAPFSGTIGILQKVNVGSMPIGDRPIVSIVNDEKMFIYAKVPSNYLNFVGLGQTIFVSLEPYKGKIFEGSVIGIDSKVDEATQTILLKIEIENKDHNLKSGIIGRIDIVTNTIEDALVVPEGSLYGLSSTRDIMLGIKNNKIVRYSVTKDFSFNENGKVYWVIKSGLKKGDVYILEIGSNTRIGATVIVDRLDGKKPKPEIKKTNKKVGQAK